MNEPNKPNGSDNDKTAYVRKQAGEQLSNIGLLLVQVGIGLDMAGETKTAKKIQRLVADLVHILSNDLGGPAVSSNLKTDLKQIKKDQIKEETCEN